MTESVAAVMILASAAIFSLRTPSKTIARTPCGADARFTWFKRGRVPKSSMNLGEHRDRQMYIETGQMIMSNHDLVSGGFLAVTVAGFALLCSSLLALTAIAFG